MPPIPWILIATAVLLVIGAVIAIINIRQKGNYTKENLSPKEQTPEQSQQPPSPEELEQTNKKEKNRKLILGIIVGITALLVVGTIVLKETGIRTGGNDDNDSSFPIAVFIPIWIALIPALKKNKKPVTPKRKKILIAIVILTVLLVIGTALFIFLRAT